MHYQLIALFTIEFAELRTAIIVETGVWRMLHTLNLRCTFPMYMYRSIENSGIIRASIASQYRFSFPFYSFLRSIRETNFWDLIAIIYTFIKSILPFLLHGCCGEREGLARKPVNHTSCLAVVTLTDKPNSVSNRCVFEHFVCVFVFSLCAYLNFQLV